MVRLEAHLALPAAALLAVLAMASQMLHGQATTPAPPAAQTGQAAASPAQAPVDPEAQGDSLTAHQRYQAAIAAYTKAPRSADVWNKMGIDYQLMFNLKDATRCYKESLKLEPRNALVLNNLATVYDSLKQYRAGEKLYHKALKIDPRSALVLKNLGTNLLAQHKYEQGWDAYKQALAIDPHIFQDRSSPKIENPASAKDRGAMNYYMARGCAREGLTDCALQYLRLALNEGFITAKKLAHDEDFVSLHGNAAFEQMLADHKEK